MSFQPIYCILRSLSSFKKDSEVFLAYRKNLFENHRKLILKHINLSQQPISLEKLSFFLNNQHENIVEVIDVTLLENEVYIEKEYVEGISLKILMKWLFQYKKDDTTHLSLWIIGQIIKALQFAAHAGKEKNSQPIHHYKLSPEHILISWNGELKIDNFELINSKKKTNLSQNYYHYLAPEQIFERQFGEKTDLFLISIIFLELLTKQYILFDQNFQLLSSQPLRKLIENSLPQNIYAADKIKNIIFTSLSLDPNLRRFSLEQLGELIIPFADNWALREQLVETLNEMKVHSKSYEGAAFWQSLAEYQYYQSLLKFFHKYNIAEKLNFPSVLNFQQWKMVRKKNNISTLLASNWPTKDLIKNAFTFLIRQEKDEEEEKDPSLEEEKLNEEFRDTLKIKGFQMDFFQNNDFSYQEKAELLRGFQDGLIHYYENKIPINPFEPIFSSPQIPHSEISDILPHDEMKHLIIKELLTNNQYVHSTVQTINEEKYRRLLDTKNALPTIQDPKKNYHELSKSNEQYYFIIKNLENSIKEKSPLFFFFREMIQYLEYKKSEVDFAQLTVKMNEFASSAIRELKETMPSPQKEAPLSRKTLSILWDYYEHCFLLFFSSILEYIRENKEIDFNFWNTITYLSLVDFQFYKLQLSFNSQIN